MLNKIFSVLLFISVFSISTNAQVSNKPDVVFKISGWEAYEELILDLPYGATLEHTGCGVYHIFNLPQSPAQYDFKIKAEGDILYGVSTVDMMMIT